jgi:RNA polymerase sigma-70 factor (ECF subfamily)
MREGQKRDLFEQAMVPYLDAAYNLARWLTRNSHDAEDIVQEAYLRAFRYFDGFAGGDGRAWMLAIVRNTCLTWRTRQRGISVVFDERTHSAGAEESSPEDKALLHGGLNSLQHCLESLPLEYREAIVMRELEDMPYKQIADVAGIPIGTVMSRLSRARKRLEDCVRAKEEAK